MKNVFITGGAGYIGSHCAISLVNNGYNPIILDNFSNSYQTVVKKLKKLSENNFNHFFIQLMILGFFWLKKP